MTRSTLDKSLATLLCALAIGSFGIQPRALAAPIFPPAHVAADARFAPATAAAATPAPRTWYRPQPRVPAPTVLEYALAARGGITPWYRTVQ